jgi:4-hydroxy-2-oxoheptanedioate aldolase
MLKNGIQIGIWNEIASPIIIDVLAKSGLDFIIIDLEHGMHNLETVQNQIFVAHSNKILVYCRLPFISRELVSKILDAGCDGLIFPNIQNLDEINLLISLSYFPPRGTRGYNPYLPFSSYEPQNQTFFESENNKLLLGIIIENKNILPHIDEILHINEINLLFIGEFDLSMSLGYQGDVTHKDFRDVFDSIASRLVLSSKKVGCIVDSNEKMSLMAKKGLTFFTYLSDTSLLRNSILKFKV